MTICPCCGCRSEFALTPATRIPCQSCGAISVGEPLPRPDHELPSYARSLVLAISGTLLTLLFLVQTVGSFAQKLPTSKTTKEAFYTAGIAALDISPWISATQTAAWRLKWIAIPITLLILFGVRRLYRSVKESPSRYCGLRYARGGYFTSMAFPLVVLILIGVTVPERLYERKLGIEAGHNALGYATDRVLLQYKKEFGTFPSDKRDLARLPDPDGSLAALLKEIDAGDYKASAEVAAVPAKTSQPLRGAVIRKASLDTDEDATESLSFTNYELRLPGYDRILNTEDDLIVRDGLITKASEAPRRPGSTAASTQTTKP